MAKFKVAAVQTYSELADSKRNLDVVVQNIREAARNGAKLVVFPECMNSGYVWRDGQHALECGDPIPGRFTDAIGKFAKELDVYVAIGLSERDGDKLYNSAALVGPNGLIGKYQKNFLFDFDPFYFTFGTTGYPVFDTQVGKIGLFICADARIPEGARMLALHGAEILLHITNNTTHEQHELHEPARANENEVWMVCADKTGREEGLTYPGHSQIIHPDGTTLVQGSEFDREIIYADIDTEEVAAVRQRGDSLMRQRRPQTYWMLKEPYAKLPYAKVASTPIIPESLAVLASPAQVCNADGDAAATLHRALCHGDEAGKENSRLIVFPELFLMRRDAKAAEAQQSAQLTEKVLREFAPLAQRWNAYYVLSLVEPMDGKLFHTAYVVGPDGKVVERYRKVHLTSAETDWATPGADYKVVQAPFGNFGLMLGQDVCFFEVARILCCMGADVIAMPSNWRTERELKMFTRERALENKVFLVAANRADAAVPGGSTVIFPNAATSNRAGKGQGDYVFSYLNLAWARDKQIRPSTDLVKNRRPQFYGAITQAVPL
ncbi:MAG: carbon-nitrogen hydrolase family protein [Rhizomicrobium sp.]